MSLGLGGVTTPVSAVSVLSVNGDVIGVGRTLEMRLRETGFAFDFEDPCAAARALAEVAEGPLVFGVPFPFSMHVELLRYWFAGTDLASAQVEVRTVPPPLMAQALAQGEVDAFCVGEPWGSVAVDDGAGALLLPCKRIWAFAPEKVLAVRSDWAETEPHLLGRLMRAVWAAGRWLSKPGNETTTAAILSRPEWLGVSSELIDRALSGRFTLSSRAEQRHVDGFLEFHHGAAAFPWRSQAKWIAHRLALAHRLDASDAQARAAQSFRSDLFRQHMTLPEIDLPGASEKVEGAIRQPTPVASTHGRMFLQPDWFFDGTVFEPDGHT